MASSTSLFTDTLYTNVLDFGAFMISLPWLFDNRYIYWYPLALHLYIAHKHVVQLNFVIIMLNKVYKSNQIFL